MEVKATPRFFNVASLPGRLSSLAGQTLVAFSHATRAGGPRVFFEVRSVAQGLYTGATTMLLHKWWKERCKGWAEPLFAHFGIGEWDFRRSQKSIAVEGHGVPADMEPFHTAEYLLSTMALLIFMCRWQCTANLASTRLAAKQMFGDIVRLVFDGDSSFKKEVVGFGMPAQLGHGQARCRKASKHPEFACSHLEKAVHWIEDNHGCLKWECTHLLMERIFPDHAVCPNLDQWLHKLFEDMSAAIDESVLRNTCGQATPEGIAPPRGTIRARRIDQAYVDMATQAMAQNRFRSAAAMQRAGNLRLKRATAQTREEVEMASYLWSTCKQAAGHTHVALSTDAGRVSGEDTLFGAAYFPGCKLAAWLVPQAP